MSVLMKNRVARLVGLSVPLLVLVAVLLVTWAPGTDREAAADFPHPGLDLSIAVDTNGDTTDDCNSSGTPTAKCTFLEAGGTFRLKLYLNSLGTVPSYQAFEVLIRNAGVTTKEGTQDANPWPQCTFEAIAPPNPARVAFGCAAFNVTSTYTGVLGTVDFNCEASGTLTLVHGQGNTSVTQEVGLSHGESGEETLTINCGEVTPPTPTNTPVAETPTPTFTPVPTTPGPTPTPTSTRPPATATPTRTPTRTPPPTPTRPPIQQGDVNGNGEINSIDALWVLWEVAGIVDQVPLPEAADLNKDGRITAVDAALILQIEAGLIPPPTH